MLGDIVTRAFEEVQGETGARRTSRVVVRAHQLIDELPEHERRWVLEQALRLAIHQKARELVSRQRRSEERSGRPRPPRSPRPPVR